MEPSSCRPSAPPLDLHNDRILQQAPESPLKWPHIIIGGAFIFLGLNRRSPWNAVFITLGSCFVLAGLPSRRRPFIKILQDLPLEDITVFLAGFSAGHASNNHDPQVPVSNPNYNYFPNTQRPLPNPPNYNSGWSINYTEPKQPIQPLRAGKLRRGDNNADSSDEESAL